ncbi:MAG: VRR-NUC domain-containing protein [Deltaproteobacteria bacterium]|nr:VRR-NUC domain-containing protein [Deltaproteobacteria bacterium]
MKQLEHQEQVALITWAELNEKKYPPLCNLFASANGGKRNIITAVKLKKSGVKAGVPDLFLAWPTKKYPGLFIEMKADKNKLSEHQKEWHDRLKKAGYAVATCYSWIEARDMIIGYLGGMESF